MRILTAALIAGLVFAGSPAVAAGDEAKAIERMLRGESWLQGKDLARAIDKADKSPLGSRENPVRVAMPQGQHAYLRGLRCADGKAPAFHRQGNVGSGVFGNIVDDYVVDCGEAAPGEVHVFMDMYHPGHAETRAVPGFTLAGAAAST